MTDDALKFTTGTGEWQLVRSGKRWAVCKFSNERMRITSDGVLFGGALRTIENSLETYWFDTWQFADAARRALEKLDAIGENFGKTRIDFTEPMRASHDHSFQLQQMSDWQCYLFGSTPQQPGITYRPQAGRVPNAFIRWCMKVTLDCTWVRDRA